MLIWLVCFSFAVIETLIYHLVSSAPRAVSNKPGPNTRSPVIPTSLPPSSHPITKDRLEVSMSLIYRNSHPRPANKNKKRKRHGICIFSSELWLTDLLGTAFDPFDEHNISSYPLRNRSKETLRGIQHFKYTGPLRACYPIEGVPKRTVPESIPLRE
jgi:hypothetical protein